MDLTARKGASRPPIRGPRYPHCAESSPLSRLCWLSSHTAIWFPAHATAVGPPLHPSACPIVYVRVPKTTIGFPSPEGLPELRESVIPNRNSVPIKPSCPSPGSTVYSLSLWIRPLRGPYSACPFVPGLLH